MHWAKQSQTKEESVLTFFAETPSTQDLLASFKAFLNHADQNNCTSQQNASRSTETSPTSHPEQSALVLPICILSVVTLSHVKTSFCEYTHLTSDLNEIPRSISTMCLLNYYCLLNYCAWESHCV